MEIQLSCLLGMACKDFAIVAADQTKSQSVIVMKDGKYSHCEKIETVAWLHPESVFPNV